MERKIGEIFEYNGEWYQTVKSQGKCCSCDFMIDGHCIVDFSSNGSCFYCHRKDKENVIFKKLEKVGETFSCNYYGDARLVMMQEYQLFNENVTYCYSMPPMYITDYKHKRIAIEITEKKENMEEYKMHDAKEDIPEFDKVVDDCLFGEDKPNLKPFDLEAAKAGKPVCTRDGRKARIICFDMKGGHSIVALTEEEDNTEKVGWYYDNGKYLSNGEESPIDLMMLPEKRSGWAKVRKDINLYGTKEEADRKMIGNDEYVTAKVFWEE